MNFENLTVILLDDLLVALIVFVIRVRELVTAATGKMVRGDLRLVEIRQDRRVRRKMVHQVVMFIAELHWVNAPGGPT